MERPRTAGHKLDVAIIGASSAGLYAAEQLARAGRQVAVFEQQTNLSPARRTLIITPQLQHLLGYLPHTAVLHRIRVLALATSGASARVELQDPDLIVERSRLAQFLACRAREAGADIYYDHRFERFESRPGGISLCFNTRDGPATVLARAVIGADGVFSDVARAAGLKSPPAVPILQAEIRLPSGWDPAVTQVWFDADRTRFFYWLIPESLEHAVVGLVGDQRAETRALLECFLDHHGFQPQAYQASLVAMHHPRLRPWGRVGSAPVLLVGDAAGQVKVTTVGGTVSGVWGAAAAVRSLLRGTSYTQELRPLRCELDLHWVIRLLLDRLDNPGYDRLVSSITPAMQRFLSRHNRDDMANALWGMPVHQSPLVALGLQLLFGRSAHLLPLASFTGRRRRWSRESLVDSMQSG